MNESNKMLIKEINIVDVENRTIVEKIDILIEEDRIKKIDRNIKSEDSCTVFDYKNNYVFPGIINNHVHSFMEPYTWDRLDRLNDSVAKIIVEMIFNLKKMLKSGVTTCREMGSIENLDIQIRDLILDNIIEGPDMICAGKPITPSGGHCYWFGNESDGKYEIIKAVRDAVKNGSDFIKIMPTGGYMRSKMKVNHDIMKDTITMSQEEIQTAVEEAHMLNKKVSAHCNGFTGVKACVDGGVDIIEHGQFAQIDRDTQMKVIEKMAAKNIWVVPTLSAYFKEYDFETIEKNYQSVIESFELYIEGGVNIAMGNDSGVPWVGHDKSFLELIYMDRYGMNTWDVLSSATIKGARLLDMDQEIGSIKENKVANLLITKENPVDSLEALNRVDNIVIKNGLIFHG